MSRVRVTGLHKRFSGLPSSAPKRGAIDGLDLEVGEREFLVLLGPSGCGKTTALRCIAGLEEPTAGEVHIGERLVAAPQRGVFTPPHRRGVGMMFQSYALWPHMTVLQNVAYPLLRLRPRPDRRSVEDTVRRTLALVGLEGFEHRRPPELSGGQQQRVALARAIVARPALVLFDEPLSNLDTQLRQRLRQDLRRAHDESAAAAIYVTHDQTEALAIADRVAVMRDGRLEQVAAPAELFHAPANRFVAEFMGYDNILPGTTVAAADGAARFRPAGWSAVLPGRLCGEARAGGEAFAAVRASALRFSSSAPSGPLPNTLGVATLRGSSFHGDHHQATAELEGRVLLGSIAVDDVAALQPGGPVFVSVAARDVAIVADAAPADLAARAAA